MYALLYLDDGPKGPCGQCMSITSPWRRLYLFDDYEEMWLFSKTLCLDKCGRKNPRLELIDGEHIQFITTPKLSPPPARAVERRAT